jgi:methylenetetrahydrofolate--tRNA-(uracil-5-)-methyltransferase
MTADDRNPNPYNGSKIMEMSGKHLNVIGGGLAGSEAAWQAADRGLDVTIYEMRPERQTPAHQTDQLAELVCSNSFGALAIDRPLGLLKQELLELDSLIIRSARQAAVPAGGALAVDRDKFSQLVTTSISSHPNITLIRREIVEIPEGPTIIAGGPLLSDGLAATLQQLTGSEHLYFFDAMAPIVEAETIDMSIAFPASRYNRSENREGDYLNCPMSKEEYERFIEALVTAETTPLRSFELNDQRFFEACLPIEVLAKRGQEAMAHGPLRPIGLKDPRTGRRPYAVVQLRQDNAAASLYNIVGFQTNVRWGEQERILRLIPGLEHAVFASLGQMHRNTYLNAPALLDSSLRLKSKETIWLAGQITGTEGYVGSTMSGLLAGVNAARYVLGQSPLVFPQTTMIGALIHYISHTDPADFQPMKANFGLPLPLDNPPKNKRQRFQALAARARAEFAAFMNSTGC